MEIKIDDHKLNYHPYTVGCWLKGYPIHPISIEISPSGTCNHRCAFCSQSYLGYKKQFIDIDILLSRLSEMYSNGTRGVVLAGEGEPMLHPSIIDTINGIKKIGLDVAMSTNGILLTIEKAKEILPSLTWIRFSFNGCTPKIYAKAHGTEINAFHTALKNIRDAVNIKRDNSLPVTIGVQYVLYNDNADMNNIGNLISHFKDIGIDYFSIKPYSAHPLSNNQIIPYDFSGFEPYQNLFESYSSADFNVFIRTNAIMHITKPKNYNHCLGIPFSSYIDSCLIVWPCLAFIGEFGYELGDLKANKYSEIIRSERYRSIIRHFETMDISRCRKSCRLDSINEYLQCLIEGVEHINFI